MFRAYADQSNEDREEGECEDDDRYSSFDQQKILEARNRRESIARAQHLVEREKNMNALRYINSDSDDDEVQIVLPTPTHFVPISTPRVDLPVEKKKKKKKSKKSKHRRHKERKRQRRRSSTSSSSTDDDSDASSSSSDDERKRKRKAPPVVVIKREKWGYLAYKEERSPEGSYIVYDKQYDHENFSMDVIPKGQTVDYRAHYYTVINGNSRLDELFFAKELRDVKDKRKRAERYFDGTLRKLDDSNVERNFRKLQSMYETNMDYVALSKTKLQEFEFLHQRAERTAMEKEREALEIEVASSTPAHAVHLETQRRLIATEFSNNKRDPDVLERFLKINEELFEASRVTGSASDRRGLAERQISIIDQAIAANQRAVEFRLKRLEYLKELRPKEELLVEWEKILNGFVNNCSVWEKYLDYIQYDSANYSKQVMERAFDRCFRKLNAILCGTFKSHKPEPNTADFLVHMYVRRLSWWMECGQTNRAIASIQATFEYNFQVPESLRHAPEDKKEEAFAAFWNSGVPRFGDEGAKGWFSFHENHDAQETDRLEVVARALQEQKTQELEQRIAASEDDLIVSWVEMERELECIESRPRRALSGSLAGIDSIHAMKEVGYGDLRILKSNNSIFVLSLLHVLGARCGTEWWSTPDKPLPRLPTFRLLEEWNLLPSVRKLYPIPSPGAQEMVLNMLRAAIHLLPDLKYIVYLLETKASQLEYLYRDRPTGVCVAHMRDFVRSIAKDYQSVVDIKDFDLVIAAYALKIFERWARDEKGSSSLSEGGDAAKDKKKKKEKNFLRSHYVEQLCAFLSNSNDVAFVQQSPRKLVVLLRMLLCLVQNLPHHRILAEITRFFLRKSKEEEVSPTEALSALDEWNNIFRTVERFDKPEKVSCFGSVRALCIALRMHFEYARASKTSDHWLKECDALYKLGLSAANDDRAMIVGAFLDVLEHHWKNYHTHKEKLLSVFEKAQKLIPYDGSLIRRRINLTTSLMEKFRIEHMFASSPSRKDPTLDMYSSLARLYLQKNRITKLFEAGALPNSDVFALITRAEASARRDPALWRLAMAQARSSRFLSETHVLASAQCGWSRNLHIDCIALCDNTKKCKEIMSLMEERGVHVFNELDYVEELKKSDPMEL